jgi:malonate decarboxylase epsilon subunit
MSSIWVYPGQGAQKINMLHDLPKHALVNQYLEQASDVLKENVMLLDQGDALKSTCSSALFIHRWGY